MDLMQMSFMGGVFILAVAAVRAVLHNRLPRKTFYVLWLAVLIRLLVPFSFSSPVSVYTLAQGSGRAMERIWGENGPFAFIARTEGLAGQSDGGVDPAAQYGGENARAANEGNPSGHAGVVTEDARVPEPGPSFWTVLWAVGVCLGSGFFTCMYIHCRREFAMSLPVEYETALKWQKNHPCRREITIRQSDRVGSPLSYGILRPVILMPKTTDWADRSRLFYVWEHEYVHIRRLDAAVKLLMAAALCIHWFNPLVWVMYVLFNRDMELSCDEAVIRHFGREARAAYAMTLIAMAEKQSGLGLLYSSFSKNVMEGRIRSIMKIRKKSIMTTVAAVLLTGAVCLVFATSPAVGKTGIGENKNGAVNAEALTDPDDLAWETSLSSETVEEATDWERIEKAVGYDRGAIRARMAEIDSTIERMNVDESEYTEMLFEEKEVLKGMLEELDLQSFYEENYGGYGVSYRLPGCCLYKDGIKVRGFFDEKIGGLLWWSDEGTVVLKVLRNVDGEILRLSEVDAGDDVWQGWAESSRGGFIADGSWNGNIEEAQQADTEARSGSSGVNADGSWGGSVEDAEQSVTEARAGSGGVNGDGSWGGGAEEAQQAVLEGSARDIHEQLRNLVYDIAHGERAPEYEECGLTYDEASGYMMYAGEKVGRFKDEWKPGTYTLYNDPTGEVAIEIIRDEDGKIICITAKSPDDFLPQGLAEEADISDGE